MPRDSPSLLRVRSFWGRFGAVRPSYEEVTTELSEWPVRKLKELVQIAGTVPLEQHRASIHRLPYIAIHCHTLPYIAIHCHTLPHIATHCHTLPYIAIHCHTLPYIAIHCHILPYIAIHCHTLDPSAPVFMWSFDFSPVGCTVHQAAPRCQATISPMSIDSPPLCQALPSKAFPSLALPCGLQ